MKVNDFNDGSQDFNGINPFLSNSKKEIHMVHEYFT